MASSKTEQDIQAEMKVSACCIIQSHIRMVKARKLFSERLLPVVVTKNISNNDGMIYKVIPKVSLLRRKRYQPFEMMNIDRDYTWDRFDYNMDVSENDEDVLDEEEIEENDNIYLKETN